MKIIKYIFLSSAFVSVISFVLLCGDGQKKGDFIVNKNETKIIAANEIVKFSSQSRFVLYNNAKLNIYGALDLHHVKNARHFATEYELNGRKQNAVINFYPGAKIILPKSLKMTKSELQRFAEKISDKFTRESFNSDDTLQFLFAKNKENGKMIFNFRPNDGYYSNEEILIGIGGSEDLNGNDKKIDVVWDSKIGCLAKNQEELIRAIKEELNIDIIVDNGVKINYNYRPPITVDAGQTFSLVGPDFKKKIYNNESVCLKGSVSKKVIIEYPEEYEDIIRRNTAVGDILIVPAILREFGKASNVEFAIDEKSFNVEFKIVTNRISEKKKSLFHIPTFSELNQKRQEKERNLYNPVGENIEDCDFINDFDSEC
ncbi:MAG: hypothetical protein IJ481_00920 [Alphaproteobacteria bacterium]|nr:hypothetical protein [Alphaproteobacteria bacterium]